MEMPGFAQGVETVSGARNPDNGHWTVRALVRIPSPIASEMRRYEHVFGEGATHEAAFDACAAAVIALLQAAYGRSYSQPMSE